MLEIASALTAGLSPFWIGVIASLIAGAATGLGALPVFFIRTLSQRLQDSLLGFGAGVMLAATCFALLVPGIESGEALFGSELTAVLVVALGVLIGAGIFFVLNHLVPHEHFIKGPEGLHTRKLRRIWLFIAAIALHNLPEGLAVGVGFGDGDLARGLTLMFGIALQNLPEGLVVAVALLSVGYSRSTAFWVALATGLVQPIGGVIGSGAVALVDTLLPFALAFAAGAMLFVISDEIIPETHRKGFEREATASLLIGFVLMMVLDVALEG